MSLSANLLIKTIVPFASPVVFSAPAQSIQKLLVETTVARLGQTTVMPEKGEDASHHAAAREQLQDRGEALLLSQTHVAQQSPVHHQQRNLEQIGLAV